MADDDGQVAGAFIGDGAYVGDGGATLQKLWEFAEWKMIRNCPGRYILKHRKSCPLQIHGVHVAHVDTDAFLAAALSVGREAIRVHYLQSERCADNVQVVVFEDAGGVITYCKQKENEGDGVVYVHTLNTASGLKRKLQGLRIDHVLH